jgi:serine/threonine protein kinase
MMAAVHEAGLVLRDSNPNNIMVTPDDELFLVDREARHPAGGHSWWEHTPLACSATAM